MLFSRNIIIKRINCGRTSHSSPSLPLPSNLMCGSFSFGLYLCSFIPDYLTDRFGAPASLLPSILMCGTFRFSQYLYSFIPVYLTGRFRAPWPVTPPFAQCRLYHWFVLTTFHHFSPSFADTTLVCAPPCLHELFAFLFAAG